MEILTVIAIAGVFMAAVSLAVSNGGPQKKLNESLEQFMEVANAASDRAILVGEPMGLVMEPPQWQTDNEFDWSRLGWRYIWKEGTDRGWVDIPEMKKPITFDPQTKFLILIDDIEWEWETLLDRSIPVTAFYPTGEISPIEIQITDERLPDYEQTIHINEYGELEWKEAAEEKKAREEASR